MSDAFAFADRLNHYVERSAYTAGQLASLSGLPKSTIVNWLQGRVARPRDWQSLIRLLSVLHLSEGEADEVLQAAGHPPLAELRRLVTEDQPLLAAWERSRPPGGTGQRVESARPFQAIPDPPYFVGRNEALQQLEEWLLAGERCVLQGLPGVGKTALAARLAYRLRPRLPDGVLWARLSASGPLAILATFARAYGVDVSDLPDLDSRSRVVRDLLADKRALLVLDDVPDSGLVEPLLPPSGRCAVLLTTRRQDLWAALGAKRLTLAPFSVEKGSARQLFAQLLGEERVAREEALFAQMAALLGHLPLALLLVASRLAYEPGWTTAAFLARLEQEQRRLQELAYGESSLRLSLEMGLEGLTAEQHRFFSLLSVFPGEAFPGEAAAAVAATKEEEAADALRTLHARSLVQAGGPGRYELHPLLRDLAASLLREEGAAGAREVAEERLVAHYHRLIRTEVRRLTAESMETLTVEEGNIAGALELAWDLGARERYRGMLLDLMPYLEQRGAVERAEALLQRAATTVGRQALDCNLWLARLARRRRRYEQAEAYLDEVEALLAATEGTQLPAARGALLTERGIIAACRHNYQRTTQLFEQAAPAVRKAGDARLLVTLLKEWGAVRVAQGQYDVAEALYNEALALAREETPVHVPGLLRALGGLLVGQSRDYQRARGYYLAALEEAQAYDTYPGMPALLNNLAVTVAATGAPALDVVQEAESILERALVLAQQHADQVSMAIILLNQGRLAAYRGEGKYARNLLLRAAAGAQAAAHASLLAAVRRSLQTVEEERGAEQLPALTIIFD